MDTVWFAIVVVMLTVFTVLDGFDFGVGIIHRFVARTDQERRTVLAAIAPVWDGNEVWLIAAGGVLFMAFPRTYATAFSGFYLALIIVLWLLILRGIAIELRSHQDQSTVARILGHRSRACLGSAGCRLRSSARQSGSRCPA